MHSGNWGRMRTGALRVYLLFSLYIGYYVYNTFILFYMR